MRVPGFLARQFIVAGSLRNTATGFQVQARNPLADGMLVGIGRLAIDGVNVEMAAVTATRDGDPAAYRAVDVSRATPVAFHKGDAVTFSIAGLALEPGDHQLEVELVERDLGIVSVGIREPLTE